MQQPEGEEQPTPIAISEVGRKGGNVVRAKYGEDYYRQIGKKGGIALKEQRGSEYYRAIARKGGAANKNKYGADHFAEMGKKVETQRKRVKTLSSTAELEEWEALQRSIKNLPNNS